MNDRLPDGRGYLVDSNSGAMYTHCDWDEGDSLMMTLISGLGELTDKDVEEIEPLQDTVDIDAIESVFQGGKRESRVSGTISFEHEGQIISISADGDVVMRESK